MFDKENVTHCLIFGYIQSYKKYSKEIELIKGINTCSTWYVFYMILYMNVSLECKFK